MLHPMLLGVFVVLLLRDILPGMPLCSPGLSHAGIAVVCTGSLALCWLGAHTGMWLSGRRCDRTGSHRSLRWAEWSHRTGQVVGFALFAGSVLCLDWLLTVRALVGDLVIVDEALAASPFLCLVAGLAWSHYPIERRVREAIIIRALDTGQAIFPIPSRGEYVASLARVSLALIVVPVVLVLAWAEAAATYGARALWAIGLRAGDSTMAVLIPLLQFAGVGVLLLLIPLLLRHVLHARPLAGGELRGRIEALWRKHRVGVRDALEWRTHGLMVNAAVLGIAGPVRYLLFTDALLAALSEERIEAVAAHEIAHARRRHLPWMMALLASMVVLIAAGIDGVASLPLHERFGAIAPVAAGLGAGAIAFALFGYVSRRFEWEADAFAVRHLAESAREGAGPVHVTSEAAGVMSGALREVAAWNHIPVRARSWRHGSIHHRRRRLQALVGTATSEMPIDRTARRIRRAIAAVAILAGTTLGVQLRSAATEGQLQEVRMRFTKMHGCGNDFVVLDRLSAPAPGEAYPGETARRLAHRTEGVGCDQVLVVSPARVPGAHLRMRVFNPDGSEAGICGNGVRCVARFGVERCGLDPGAVLIETESGVREVSCRYAPGEGFVSATADMGAPVLDLERVPVEVSGLARLGTGHEHRIEACGREWPVAFVSTGNPHAVLFPEVPEEEFDLAALGPAVEHHGAFPERANVQVVWVRSPERLVLRTWERGTGPTRACGTGACAAVVAGVVTGRSGASARIEMVGGTLYVEWDRSDGRLRQSGPAAFVFDGELDERVAVPREGARAGSAC